MQTPSNGFSLKNPTSRLSSNLLLAPRPGKKSIPLIKSSIDRWHVQDTLAAERTRRSNPRMGRGQEDKNPQKLFLLSAHCFGDSVTSNGGSSSGYSSTSPTRVLKSFGLTKTSHVLPAPHRGCEGGLTPSGVFWPG